MLPYVYHGDSTNIGPRTSGEVSMLRVLFFGMEGAFSRAPLAALWDAGCDVCAVVVPRPSGMTPAVEPVRRLAPPRRPAIAVLATADDRTAVGMAWARDVPVLEVARLRDARTLDALSALRPDALCTACFPRLLPPELLRLLRLGAFNVHPSLLPAFRGSAPLFWVFHDGLEHAGVTVHAMDAHADTGDIVRQAPVALPDGVGYGEAERRCSTEGARLLVDALRALQAGTLTRRPQPRVAASPAPFPGDGDFVVTPDWSARRAFNFIHGLGEWGRPITFSAGEERFTVREAVRFDEAAVLAAPFRRAGTHLVLRCSPGVLTVVAGEPRLPV